MAFALTQGVDLKLCPDDILGVQQLLKEIDFPTPPLSPDQEVKDAAFEGSTTLLPELQPVVPADSSDLDIDTVFKKAGLTSDSEFFENFYGNPDLEFISPSILEEPKGILQDCMWGSVTYEPRHSAGGGSAGNSPEGYTQAPSSPDVYTPAPSPPEEYTAVPSPAEVYTPAPSPPEIKEEVEEEEDGDGDESYEDIDVEEIDVVTISDKPVVTNPLSSSTRLNIRKRTLSQSTPLSRQCSPAVSSPFQPMKRRRSHTKRAHRLSSAGSMGDNMESDEEQKRTSHNILERKRRNDLKKSYQALRNNIPELEDNQRAPKVTILRKATEFISEIKVRNSDLQRKFDQEKKKEMHLLQRLALLKSVLKSC